MLTLRTLLVPLVLLLCSPASGQQSETFGPYELHYSVVNTTFIDAKVAATYGITRGKKRAILNLSVREQLDEVLLSCRARPQICSASLRSGVRSNIQQQTNMVV